MMNIGCGSEEKTQVNLVLFFTRLSLYLQTSLRLLIAIVLVKRDFYLLICKIFAKSYADSFLERENGRVGQDI